MKPKAELMRRLRAQRQADGWVQINLWVPKELVPKIRAYVRKLVRTTDGDTK